jgi:hypothetical protein
MLPRNGDGGSWRAELSLNVVGCLMKSYKAFPFLILVACVFLGSCSGLPHGTGGGGGGGGSTADISFVMISDTPPATLGLVSFKIVPTSVTLTSSTGTTTTLNVNGGNGFSYDLVRLQSDSGYLGTAPNLATGTYTSIGVTFSGATLAFFNGTGATITNLAQSCLANTVCVATFPGPFTSTITASQSISANAGIEIDINLANSLVLTGSSLSLNFANSGSLPVTTAVSLPTPNSNLASGQLALIEDITGVATVGNPTVAVAPATVMNSFPIAAVTSSTTAYDSDPTNTLCPAGTTQLTGCVSSNQAVSMDAILNSDGTFTIQEIEPLLPSPIVDTVEGTVTFINSSTNATNLTQFSMIITNLIPAATNSLIGSLSVSNQLNVTLSNSTIFYVDSKGLPVASQFPASYGTFTSATNTSGLHLGQTVAVHVTAFTAAIGTTTPPTPAVATANTVFLRWSRFSAGAAIATSPAYTINALPGHFGFSQGITFVVQTFTGTPGFDGVTNLDGVTSTANLAVGQPVATRALFIENPGASLNPAFFAAKVRQR